MNSIVIKPVEPTALAQGFKHARQLSRALGSTGFITQGFNPVIFIKPPESPALVLEIQLQSRTKN